MALAFHELFPGSADFSPQERSSGEGCLERAGACLVYGRSCGMNSALLFAADVRQWFMASIHVQNLDVFPFHEPPTPAR